MTWILYEYMLTALKILAKTVGAWRVVECFKGDRSIQMEVRDAVQIALDKRHGGG